MHRRQASVPYALEINTSDFSSPLIPRRFDWQCSLSPGLCPHNKDPALSDPCLALESPACLQPVPAPSAPVKKADSLKFEWTDPCSLAQAPGCHTPGPCSRPLLPRYPTQPSVGINSKVGVCVGRADVSERMLESQESPVRQTISRGEAECKSHHPRPRLVDTPRQGSPLLSPSRSLTSHHIEILQIMDRHGTSILKPVPSPGLDLISTRHPPVVPGPSARSMTCPQTAASRSGNSSTHQSTASRLPPHPPSQVSSLPERRLPPQWPPQDEGSSKGLLHKCGKKNSMVNLKSWRQLKKLKNKDDESESPLYRFRSSSASSAGLSRWPGIVTLGASESQASLGSASGMSRRNRFEALLRASDASTGGTIKLSLACPVNDDLDSPLTSTTPLSALGTLRSNTPPPVPALPSLDLVDEFSSFLTMENVLRDLVGDAQTPVKSLPALGPHVRC